MRRSRSLSAAAAPARARAGRRLAFAALLLPLAVFVVIPSGKADPLAEQATVVDRKLIEEVKAHAEVMANLTHLSDVIGPRLTGSANLKRANEWAAEKMRAYGLSNVRLEPWTIPQGWERGTATARIVEPENGRSLTVAAAGWAPGTKGKVVGDVVVLKASNRDELNAYKGKLKDAVVLRGAPVTVRPVTEMGSPIGLGGGGPRKPAADRAGDKPGEPGKDRPAFRGGGQFGERMAFLQEMGDFLRKEGVAAILTDAGKPHGLLTMGGRWRGTDRGAAATEQEPIPTLFVAHEHYALLHRLATRPAPAKTRLEVEVSNTFVPGPVTVYNTVGEVRGSEKPDEVVVVGAHLDSWDLGQGTTDNGTGSCVVLETARALVKSGVRPKRTVRFCLFTGEEQGLFGSKAYVQAHKDELPKTTAALVHDTGTGKVVGVSLSGRPALKPIMEAELATLKELGVKDVTPGGLFGGSDHASFEQGGVPGFLFVQDPAEYRLTHHSQSDTLDKAREPDLIQGAQVMAVAAVRIANLPSLLPRDKPKSDRPRDGGKPAAEKPADKPREEKKP